MRATLILLTVLPLGVIWQVASADLAVRQQRIVRRPQEFAGHSRPAIPIRHGTNSKTGPPAPPFRSQSPFNNHPAHKKPLFLSNRPKSPLPAQATRPVQTKSPPKVEYGFTPINVANDGYVVSKGEESKPKESSSNDAKRQEQHVFSHHESRRKPVTHEKKATQGQHNTANFDGVRNQFAINNFQNNFPSNAQQSSAASSVNPTHVSNQAASALGHRTPFPHPSTQFQSHVPTPQLSNNRGQIHDSKVVNTGTRFYVQDTKSPGSFAGESLLVAQDSNVRNQVKALNNNGFQRVPTLHQQNAGPNVVYVPDPKVQPSFVNNVPPGQPHPEKNIYGIPNVPGQFGPPQFPVQGPFFQDQKFINGPQVFIQNAKPFGPNNPAENFNRGPIQNQKLQAHYQIQDPSAPFPVSFQNVQQFPVHGPQFINPLKSPAIPAQLSIPVGATFPFGVNPNQFPYKGVVQGQVIPVPHTGIGNVGKIPQFAPLPTTVQFSGVEDALQGGNQLVGDQDVTGSHSTRKVVTAVHGNTETGPTKPKKTTLKDILVEDCAGAEEFGYCASPPRYPTQQISAILKQCSDHVQPAVSSPVHHISERANTEPWSWSSYDEDEKCVSTTGIVEPGYARDSRGHWLVILQHHSSNIQQRIAVDVCAHEGGSCGCEQQYETKELVAWDPDKPHLCPALKSFKFPIKCVCPGEKTQA